MNSNYQVIIDSDTVSQPMEKEEAAAWVGLLRVTFPGAVIDAELLPCPECGNLLPDSGPCWHNLFAEEFVTSEEMMAALGQGIPFQGEPMPNREVDTRDYYGL